MFELDPYLVMAAAEASPVLNDRMAIDYRELVARLSRSEADDFLVRLAMGDAGVRIAVRKRLSDFVPKETVQTNPPRPLQRILKRAEQLEKDEKERKAQEAQKRHIAAMKALAQREPQTWKQIDDLLANGKKIASVYDQATDLLEQLKQLADFQDTHDNFFLHVRSLASKYGSRSSLMDRWKKHGWL